MGFYFAYVVYTPNSKDLEYYFVQQDLTVPWELSSAKDDYKYSDKISHLKCANNNTGNPDNPPPHIWQINGMMVSANGRYIHAVYPHDYLFNASSEVPSDGFALPRQFKMTTPWDISTAKFSYAGVGGSIGLVLPGWHQKESSSHGVHWDESGENCYFSYVQESSPKQDPGYYNYTAGVYKQNRFLLKM
jgi:hypothetical protein